MKYYIYIYFILGFYGYLRFAYMILRGKSIIKKLFITQIQTEISYGLLI
ncbi:hypothetical protein [Caldicellulosiruptor saccharolyticus]|nr:hypothetical protein [Caldicellulosiruptor saccharolyticus]